MASCPLAPGSVKNEGEQWAPEEKESTFQAKISFPPSLSEHSTNRGKADELCMGTFCGLGDLGCSCFSSGAEVGWLRYSFHHKDTNCSMRCDWLSSMRFPALHGFIAPVKWTILASWPNLAGMEKKCIMYPLCTRAKDMEIN